MGIVEKTIFYHKIVLPCCCPTPVHTTVNCGTAVKLPKKPGSGGTKESSEESNMVVEHIPPNAALLPKEVEVTRGPHGAKGDSPK